MAINLAQAKNINTLASASSEIKQEQEAGFANISITLNVSQELVDSLTAFDVNYSVNTPTEPVVTE